jgi:DNA modification methylase
VTARKATPAPDLTDQAIAADRGVAVGSMLDEGGQLLRELVVEWVPITKVTPYPDNPRIPGDAIQDVRDSLLAFNWQQPLVLDVDYVIVVGHTRYYAALDLRQTHVPVYIARRLTPELAAAYRLADNKIHERSQWDFPKLTLNLTRLRDLGVDLRLTGFRPLELRPLLEPDGKVQTGTDPDSAPSIPKKPVTQPDDLIELGRHRLLCGDATNEGDWLALMNDVKANMLWTDPPYGVAFSTDYLRDWDGGRKRPTGAKEIAGDDLDDEKLLALLSDSFRCAALYCRAGACWYVSAPSGPTQWVFGQVLRGLDVWRLTIAWVKDSFVLSRSDYHYRHESILYGWLPGAAHFYAGDRTQDTIWEIPRPKASEEHPTMKPVELVARAIRNSSQRGEVIVDPFAGSGTTVIAAEREARRAYVMEIDPRYCDVIVRRWEETTGQKAVRPIRKRASA